MRNLPPEIRINKKAQFNLRDFLGVDFTTHESEVNFKRSPDAVNLISGKKGSLDKRYGTEIHDIFPSGEVIQTIYPIQFSFNSYLDPNHPSSDYTNMILKMNLIVTFDNNNAYVYLGQSVDKLKILIETGTVYTLGTFTQSYEFTDKVERKIRFIKFDDYNYLMIGLPKTYMIHLRDNNGNTSVFPDPFLPTGTQYTDDVIGYIVDFQLYKSLQFKHFHIPTLEIARKPEGTVSTSFEEENMLSYWVKNDFLADGTSTIYKCNKEFLDTSLVKVYKKLSGVWTLQTTGYTVANSGGVGQVTFTTAPVVPTTPGEDNVRVEFTIARNFDLVNLLANYGFYGYNGKTDFAFVSVQRILGTGGQNEDYRIKLDTKYMRVNSFSKLGDSIASIQGYAIYNNYLVTITRNIGNNPTLFLRTATLDSQGEEIFPIEFGRVGVGAVNGDTFANLRGDTIWLSEYGVGALVTNNVTNTQAIQDRSFYINEQLLSTNNYNAIGIVYDNKYYLFNDDGCYVADSRKRYSESLASSESYQYDWYYFNIKGVKAVSVLDDRMYFSKGNIIYKFRRPGFNNTNLYIDVVSATETVWATNTNYYEGNIVSYESKYYSCLQSHKSDTVLRNPTNAIYWQEVTKVTSVFYVPVLAYWTTPIMNMGDMTSLKTLKNLWVRLGKYANMSARIYYSTQGLISEKYDGIFDFSNIDFSRFTFSTDTDPSVLVTNRQERKFMSIQFKIESRDSYPFSLLEIVGEFILNGKYKG